jgi:hypothetical protein
MFAIRHDGRGPSIKAAAAEIAGAMRPGDIVIVSFICEQFCTALAAPAVQYNREKDGLMCKLILYLCQGALFRPHESMEEEG